MSRLTADKIKIRSVKAYYDDSSKTEVEETESMLFYKTQTFYCRVELEIPTSIADRDWSIGLVQACDYMHLENEYDGMGSSLWEFHPLKSGIRNLINDSDGRQYPFYSVNQSLFRVKRGVVRRVRVTLQIKDYFHPSVVWELPYAGGVQLTEIARLQKFLIWLVAIKHGKKGTLSASEEIHVLKEIRWQYKINMTVDPYMVLGDRVKYVDDCQDDRPEITDPEANFQLPVAATCPPHCNAAQSLIWYPRDSRRHARILVPPKQIIVSWENWVMDMIGANAHIRKPSEVSEVISLRS